jgi:hypothetical protein
LTDRRLALIAGILYLLTFVTSIPALALKTPYLDGGVDVGAVRTAAVLEIVLALACVGTAVALFPIVRRASLPLALGFVASRTLEATLVLLGVVALLGLEATRAGGGAGDVALIAVHDQAFLLGPGLLPAVNALLLATALYRARLVPRIIPLVGLIGAPLLLVSALGTVFGVVDQVSPVAGLLALPIALWEFSLGVWLVVRGTRPAAT